MSFHVNFGLVTPTNYVLLNDNGLLPLTFDEVLKHLKLEDSPITDDVISLISVANLFAEKVLGRDLTNKTYKTYLDNFPCGDGSIQILKSKLQSITSIKYFVDGVLTTLATSVYLITDSSEYSKIFLNTDQSWPTNVDSRQQAIEIEFVAGYGTDCSQIPDLIRRGLLAHIISLNEHRGDCDHASISKQALALYQPCIVSSKLFDVI